MLQPPLFTISSLNINTLESAQHLRDSVFDDLDYNELLTLKASLNPKEYETFYTSSGIKELSYWTLIEKDSSLVIGLIGLYRETYVKNRAWLGWFCVEEKYRGYSLGTKLLDFAIDEAKNQGYKELHLYTAKDEKYLKACQLYESRGFTPYRTGKNTHALYYRLNLVEKADTMLSL